MRTRSEIDVQVDLALSGVEQGTQYSGMSYEEGVLAALDWVIERSDDPPMEIA